jgi:bidirectional [NiFe] hydrogenase diaphorase subunit
VVANGDEGDPGAFMDRTVLESDPHRLLEGLAIAAWAVEALRGRCGPAGVCRGLTERLGPGLRASPDRRAHSSH